MRVLTKPNKASVSEPAAWKGLEGPKILIVNSWHSCSSSMWMLRESYDVGAEIEKPKHADLEFECLRPCARMERPIDGLILQYHMRDICPGSAALAAGPEHLPLRTVFIRKQLVTANGSAQ